MVLRASGPCPAAYYSSESDKWGDQAIACATDGKKISYYNRLLDAIFHSAAAAATCPTRGLLPSSEARQADIFLPEWDKGKDAALNVTVISPLQSNLVNHFGVALGIAHKRKMTAPFDDCAAQNVFSTPCG